MDLVSNLANTVISKAVEGNSQETVSQVDLNDTTFSDLLEKQLNNQPEQYGQNFIDNMGISSVSGIDICDIVTENNIGQFNAINSAAYDKEQLAKFNSGKDFSMEEVLTLYNPPVENKPTMTDNINSNLFNFECKSAANQYSKYSKNIVVDLGEFVEDALKIS